MSMRDARIPLRVRPASQPCGITDVLGTRLELVAVLDNEDRRVPVSFGLAPAEPSTGSSRTKPSRPHQRFRPSCEGPFPKRWSLLHSKPSAPLPYPDSGRLGIAPTLRPTRR